MAIISSILRGLKIVKPLPKEPVNINKDSKAIIDFLLGMDYDREHILRLFKKFLELRLDYHALTDEEVKLKNLRQQITIFDQLIQSYSFFQADVDINGNRVKQIAGALKQMAAKSGEADLLAITGKLHWKFDW